MPKPNDENVLPAPQTISMPVDMMAALLERVGQLVDHLDREPQDDGSRAVLMKLLEEHGKALKGALAPENRLHHEVSYLHPEGRAVERPRLKRELYFLGVTTDPNQMRDSEILAANRISDSLEIPAKRWVARILKDQAGKEIVYVSVPFQGFDDLRGLGGGLEYILNTIADEGTRPMSQDVLLDRLARAENLIAELQASRSTADVPPAPAA